MDWRDFSIPKIMVFHGESNNVKNNEILQYINNQISRFVSEANSSVKITGNFPAYRFVSHFLFSIALLYILLKNITKRYCFE